MVKPLLTTNVGRYNSIAIERVSEQQVTETASDFYRGTSAELN